MKECPKCQNIHTRPGTYCSRSCANSRTWSTSDKILKSSSAKKSPSVLASNRSHERRKSISERMKALYASGKQCNLTKEDKIKGGRAKPISTLDSSIEKDYRRLCKFMFSLSEYPDKFDFSLIENHGWYLPTNRGNNPNGVSRDHMLSIKEGWRNKVPAWKIAHPANCRLLLQRDNAKKQSQSIINETELDVLIAQF